MSERDYSEITWPWDDDPNWGPPREGATYSPGDEENWRLGCGECGLYFPRDIEVGVIGAHWKEQHYPEWTEDHQEPNIQLDLVWVGLGTPPPGEKP